MSDSLGNVNKISSKINELKCSICNIVLSSKLRKKRHLLQDHNVLENFSCVECGKGFKTKYRMKIHMNVHVKVLNINLET